MSFESCWQLAALLHTAAFTATQTQGTWSCLLGKAEGALECRGSAPVTMAPFRKSLPPMAFECFSGPPRILIARNLGCISQKLLAERTFMEKEMENAGLVFHLSICSVLRGHKLPGQFAHTMCLRCLSVC